MGVDSSEWRGWSELPTTSRTLCFHFDALKLCNLRPRQRGASVVNLGNRRYISPVSTNKGRRLKVMGVEFASSNMHYVVIELADGNEIRVVQSSKLILGETRSRNALVAFQSAVSTLLNLVEPSLIGVKAKPESGQMRAGAASLKMEGILLANAPCEVDFVSGVRVNACTVTDSNLHAYLHPALKTAHVALAKKLK